MRYFKYTNRSGKVISIYKTNDTKTHEEKIWFYNGNIIDPSWQPYIPSSTCDEQEITEGELFLYML